MKKLYYLAIALATSGALKAQDVTVNLNMTHSVNGVTELDRNKFFIIHHGIEDSDWDSEARQKEFLEDNDVYMGRATGGISFSYLHTKEDPNKPGWPDVNDITKQGKKSRDKYAKDTFSHQFEDRSKMMVIGGQPLKVYPNGTKTKKGWAYENYEAVDEFYTHYLDQYFGEGGETGRLRPGYLEVLNEPFVKTKKLGTTTEKLSEMHCVVAKRVKEMHPEIKVGGYGAAHPAYQANGFKHWESRWKTFIDVAGKDMDFFSYHLYDNHKKVAIPPVKRKGSNIEAIMDMIEHYTVLKQGQRKPVYITEFGYFLQEAVKYNKQSDWYQLRAYNSMVMQFMERQDVIIGAIPFMILKAEWGRSKDGIPYGPRVMRQKKEVPGFTGNGDDWVYTDLIKYFQFWKDLKGNRAESHSNNMDILTDAYVDGNKAYVMISNLSTEDRELNLTVNQRKSVKPVKVSMSHIHANDKDEPIWDQYEVKDPSKVTIGREATMILTYEYDRNIKQNEKVEETKYFADEYLQNIKANTPIKVNFNGVETSKYGEAMLRLGLGRNHGLSLHPTVKVNGEPVDVPTNWRGDDQEHRKEFFGVLEVPVPNQLLKENNEIQISFNDEGGHVSSMTMQYMKTSKSL